MFYNRYMLIANNWKEYVILDAGDKEKLELWNDICLVRPDPSCLWPKEKTALWTKADAYFRRSNKGGGRWEYKKDLKDKWLINYQDLKFLISPTNFKHTGLFPEQASNWDIIRSKISARKDVRVLNLFAYSGAASIAASKAGASEVVHVDSSSGMIKWAKENLRLNRLEKSFVRFIEDDCLKFMKREIRRLRKYDLIILDPPSYGRGPNNEVFKIEDQINELLNLCKELLSDNPIGIILNTYTTGMSKQTLKNILSSYFPIDKIQNYELCLKIKDSKKYLVCGMTSHVFF